LRDYQQINAELVRLLNLGHSHIRLEGVEGQRLLALRLSGSWQAVVELDGNAGPELAAELDAPGLLVICRGSAADGAGRGMSAGRLLILGTAGTGLGYAQRGGLIVAVRPVGPRAGLGQLGGDLVLLDGCGSLAGERQSGGRLFLRPELAGPHAGFAARGGRMLHVNKSDPNASSLDSEQRRTYEAAVELAGYFSNRT
jgi:glutamate synthase domain-containing protein 3